MGHVGIVIHRGRPEAAALARRAIEWLTDHGHDIKVPAGDATAVGLDEFAYPDDALCEHLDLALSLGGDGTMLRTVDLVSTTAVPVLGINVGHLGYLNECDPAELESALEKFYGGQYSIEERMTLNVTATPPPQTTEGDYPLLVEALAGDHSVSIDLLARITGRVAMEFSTSDQRLNATAVAGGPTELDIVVVNTGTAALTGLSLSGDGPSEWEVTFDPAEVAQIAPGQSATATAVVTPSGNAVAGDYVVEMTASADGVEEALEIRVTVETAPIWAAVGIGLILLTLGGMVWIFRRYGRR